MFRVAVACFLLIALFMSEVSFAQQAEPFAVWLQKVEADSVAAGINPMVVKSALSSVEFDEQVIELDRRQPESTISFNAYSRGVITPNRVKRGSALLQAHAELLRKISDRYGVPPEMMIALWGVESSFGNSTGNFNILNSLATLGYDGRRSEFFRGELISALQILDHNQQNPSDLLGSWAGAIGQCQFLPSTYIKYAVDYDGDGRRDIWSSDGDVLASISNYLVAEGWQRGLTWGREVKLTKTISSSLVGVEQKHLLKEWSNLGVVGKNGKPLPARQVKASLVQPDGPHGRSFLVYDNFRVLMRWNRSTYFATAIGLFSDQIKTTSVKRR